MAIKPIKNVTLTVQNSPDEILIVNALGEAEHRLPTNAAKNLILEAGNIKLHHPEEYRKFIASMRALEQQDQSA